MTYGKIYLTSTKELMLCLMNLSRKGMNNMELQAQNDIASKLIEWIESSKDFISGQLPDYVHQFIKYKTIQCYLNITLLSFMTILLTIFWIYSIVKLNTYEKQYDCPSLFVLGTFICPAPIFGLCCVLVGEIHTIIQIHIAPKVYILSHLNDLIRGG
jgi:hypothetical protein